MIKDLRLIIIKSLSQVALPLIKFSLLSFFFSSGKKKHLYHNRPHDQNHYVDFVPYEFHKNINLNPLIIDS